MTCLKRRYFRHLIIHQAVMHYIHTNNSLYVQVWAASQWRKSACRNCNISKHSNSFLKCLQMNLMQAERLWSFRAICAPAATLISEQPLQHDYRAPPPGYRILPCRLNSRRPQFLPQAFHFPPLQLTAQHILHSYRAGSAVCCKASNTMTRLQQPASGWEKHATEQERGFFVPKGLLIKCLTCHSAPGTAERAAVIQMFSVNQRSLSADRNRERQSLNVRVRAAEKHRNNEIPIGLSFSCSGQLIWLHPLKNTMGQISWPLPSNRW